MSQLSELKAIRDSVSFMLSTFRSGHAAYFDFDDIGNLFKRFISISDSLRNSDETFKNLPLRDYRDNKLVSFDQQQLFSRKKVELLLMDVDYCIKLLSEETTIDIPSLKVSREGLFFSGQYFDAIQRVSDIFSVAKQSITIIDGYVNQKILSILTGKDSTVDAKILTKEVSPLLKTMASDFNRQYGRLSIRVSSAFHDRFIIIDDMDFYHFGASIKDLGNRGFMFSRIEEPELTKTLLNNFQIEWSKAKIEV
jgi:hypothetical protein